MGSVEKRLDISLNTELQVPSVLSTDFLASGYSPGQGS